MDRLQHGERKNATSVLEKVMYNLISNAVYGSAMENGIDHVGFELVDTPERFQQCVKNPAFKYVHAINEDLVGVDTETEQNHPCRREHVRIIL